MTLLREDFDVVVRPSGVDVTFKPTKGNVPVDVELEGAALLALSR